MLLMKRVRGFVLRAERTMLRETAARGLDVLMLVQDCTLICLDVDQGTNNVSRQCDASDLSGEMAKSEPARNHSCGADMPRLEVKTTSQQLFIRHAIFLDICFVCLYMDIAHEPLSSYSTFSHHLPGRIGIFIILSSRTMGTP